MQVLKRGRSTRKTLGTVTNVNVSGVSADALRQFTNAFMIQSQTNDPLVAKVTPAQLWWTPTIT